MQNEQAARELNTAVKWLTWSKWLIIPTIILVTAALYGAFIYAPTEKQMGEVQRIFYFHVGAAADAFLAFFIVFIAGILYLIKKDPVWDQLAAASVEVGVLFTTIVLTTGPIWAKPVWNTWFPWGDPRIMTTLVLWLIYLAYLILRSSLPEGDRRSRICAVFGIIGFIDVPIVWMSIRWWRSIHPVVITSEGANLDPLMYQALMLSIFACLAILAVLVLLRGSVRLNSLGLRRITQEILDRRSV